MPSIQYNTRKSIAKGMLDVALLLSNVSRMKMLLVQDCVEHAKCVTGVSFLSISIILQIVVGIMLIKLGIREHYSNMGDNEKVKGQEQNGNESSQEREKSEENLLTNPFNIKPSTETGKQSKKLIRQTTIAEENNELKKDKLTRNLNTVVLIIVFVIVVLNIVIDGLDLSAPPVPSV